MIGYITGVLVALIGALLLRRAFQPRPPMARALFGVPAVAAIVAGGWLAFGPPLIVSYDLLGRVQGALNDANPQHAMISEACANGALVSGWTTEGIGLGVRPDDTAGNRPSVAVEPLEADGVQVRVTLRGIGGPIPDGSTIDLQGRCFQGEMYWTIADSSTLERSYWPPGNSTVSDLEDATIAAAARAGRHQAGRNEGAGQQSEGREGAKRPISRRAQIQARAEEHMRQKGDLCSGFGGIMQGRVCVLPDVAVTWADVLPDARAECGRVSGEWKTFSNGCTDLCSFEKHTICAAILTDACDCGWRRCWTGTRGNSGNEIGTCVGDPPWHEAFQ